MAKVLSGNNILDAYLTGCQELLACKNHKLFNLILEIENPVELTAQHKSILNSLSTVLVQNEENSIETVANTIFPQQMYRRHGVPDFYKKYDEMLARAKKPSTWGTYFQRLTSFAGVKGKGINQLDLTITKLRRSMKNAKRRSIYELNVSGIGLLDEDIGSELVLYSPSNDGLKIMNMPCLSHISFKLDSTHLTLDLTAIYRSQYYCTKALGNLLGLARLQKFLCNEVPGIEPGKLTCISTDAYLDMRAFGGAKNTKQLIEDSCNKM